MDKCGIYFIGRLSDKKGYVGQSINCRTRFNHHKHHLRLNTHANKRLQNSWNLHGEDKFEFIVLHECLDHELDFFEQKYLDIFKADGYEMFNFGDCAPTPNKGRKLGPLSEEHKSKIANSIKGTKKSPEECKAISQRTKGKKASDQTKLKQRFAKLGKKLSDDHKKALSIARSGKPHPVNEEARLKLIERNKNQVFTVEMLEKMRNSSLGRRHTDEVKEKCRQASLAYWAKKKSQINKELPCQQS